MAQKENNTGFDDYDVSNANVSVGNDVEISGQLNDRTEQHKMADFGKAAFNDNRILSLLSGTDSDRELAVAIIKARTVRHVTVTNNIILLAGKRGSGKTSHNNAFIATCMSETDPTYKAEDELFDLLRYSPPSQVADLSRAISNPNFAPGYFHYLERSLSKGVVYEEVKKGDNTYNVLTLEKGINLFVAHAQVVKELLDSVTAKNANIKTLNAINDRKEGDLIIPTTLYTESRDGIYENSSFYTDLQIKGYGDSIDIVFSVNRLHAMVDEITEEEIGKIIDEIRTYAGTLRKSMLQKVMSKKEIDKLNLNDSKLADLFKVSVIVKNGFTAQVRISFYFPYESIIVLAGCNRNLKVVSYDENTPMGAYIDADRDDKSTILKGGLSKVILYKPSTMSLLMNSINCTVSFELRDDGDNKDIFMGINADVMYFAYDGYNTQIDAERYRSRFVTKNNLISNGIIYKKVFNTFHETVLSTNFINNIINSPKLKTNKEKIEMITNSTLMADKLLKTANKYIEHINFNKNIISIIGFSLGNKGNQNRAELHKEFIHTSNTLVTDIVDIRRELGKQGVGDF